MRTWQSSEEPSTRDGAMRRGWREASIGDFRQSRRQRLRNAEAAERSLQGEIARERDQEEIEGSLHGRPEASKER